MDRVSRPMQIALVASVLFAVLWFVALSPGPPEPEPPMPGENVAGEAQPGAAGGTDTPGAARAGDTPAAPAAPAAPAKPATPAVEGRRPPRAEPVDLGSAVSVARAGATMAGGVVASAGVPRDRAARGGQALPRPLQRALDQRKVVVLLFWERGGAEDRHVRKAVASIDRRNGRVVVVRDRLGNVARYGQIARSAGVTQAPTVLVVNGSRQVEVITGYTDAGEIDQAVTDAIQATRKGGPPLIAQ
jgi:hypothetical protein